MQSFRHKMKDPLVFIYQEVFHRHLQKPGQGKQVVHCRQALAVLPFIYGLRVFKPEIGLKIPYGQPCLTAVLFYTAAGSGKTGDGSVSPDSGQDDSAQCEKRHA